MMRHIFAFLTTLAVIGLPGAATAQETAADNQRVLQQDEVFRLGEDDAGQVRLRYIWPSEATVYQGSAQSGDTVFPGRELCVLKIGTADGVPARSKAHVQAGETYEVVTATIQLGQHLSPGDDVFVLRDRAVTHDSATRREGRELNLGSLLKNLWHSTGIRELIVQTGNDWTLGWGRLVMMLVGLVLLYLAIFKKFEPLLLVPIGFGAIMTNIPLAGLSGPDGILGILYGFGIENGVFPLLIFMGVGAMTDFGPLIANPRMALLGAAAQLGIFSALLGALALGAYVPGIEFSLQDAASIGIIGGADGPTSIFLAGKLSPNLLGAIAVAAYSYMALVPIIQPPIMKLMTTPEQRRVRMTQLRHVSKLEKVCFPVGITLLCAFLLPDAAPLISMLMFGNLLKECAVVDRLSDTTQNALINIVTIFLGLTVGSKLSADKFLNAETLGILTLGLLAFVIGTFGGLLLGQVMHKLSGGKVNPLIGAAGVSAVPMAARVVNKVGMDEDDHNFLLMHAMGPNVAGVIGSAVAAGVLLNALQ